MKCRLEFKPRKGFDMTVKHLEKISGSEAEWGVYSENGIHEESGLKYTELMAIHELRDDEWKRPVFKITANNNRFVSGYKKLLASGLETYITRSASGTFSNVDKVLKPVAELGRKNADKVFGSKYWLKKNTKETIKRKGHSKPLVEFGDLRKIVRDKVIKKG